MAHHVQTLYNYTTLWAKDLLPRSTTAPASDNCINPMLVNDYSISARRRWARCVCAGFLLSFVVNVASTVFVVVRLQSAATATDDRFVERFLRQNGSSAILQNTRRWTTLSGYYEIGEPVHEKDVRIAIHMVLGNNTLKPTVNNRLSGWIPKETKYFDLRSDVLLDESREKLTINRTGLYQVYSQLTFTAQRNNPLVNVVYGQQLYGEKDNDRWRLLRDEEYKTCTLDTNAHLPCHTSVLFSAIRLEQGTSISIEAQPIGDVIRDDLSFFGVFRLSS
jgi:hypothetical protein